MKANELMIGDWVMPLKKKLKSIPGKVVTIDGGTGVCWIDSEDYSCLVPCSDVERIPITTEILEKNGLLDIAHSEYYVHYDKHDEEWYFIYSGSFAEMEVSITAVNELQHAIRLCGIDKEIVL